MCQKLEKSCGNCEHQYSRENEPWDTDIVCFCDIDGKYLDYIEDIHNEEACEKWEESEDSIDARNLAEAKAKWLEFGDVPMDPETECIESEWNGFPAGTFREEIWHWFEDTYNLSVACDLMGL